MTQESKTPCVTADFGQWKGQAISQLNGDQLNTWLTDSTCAPHGGESVDDVCTRVAQWMKSLETQPGHVVAITHPFVIRAALPVRHAVPAVDVLPDRRRSVVGH